MKDNYSFDLDAKGAKHSYNKMFVAYLRTFARMGLKAIPMRADTGPIGGDLSHEFQILADTGESEVYVDRDFLDLNFENPDVDYDDDQAVQTIVDYFTSLYAATGEIHKPGNCPVTPERLVTARGIEVGQTFYFGTKYSKPMGAVVVGADGAEVPLEMGSYGIGVSRLVGALIEANHDDAGIIWPVSVAPFRLGLINLRPADDKCRSAGDDLYGKLRNAGIEVLYDDRDESPGAKFATMDLIGLPDQLILGPRGLAAGNIEWKERRSGARQDLRLGDIVAHFAPQSPAAARKRQPAASKPRQGRAPKSAAREPRRAAR
jgi:prolyl-tRNA synthetase